MAVGSFHLGRAGLFCSSALSMCLGVGGRVKAFHKVDISDVGCYEFPPGRNVA
jgi:hypothetical protein